MAKKRAASVKPIPQEQPATLKDMLNPDVIGKLKAQAEQLREINEKQKEEKRKQVEEARRAEQKRLDNNFEHLLNNSDLDWRNFKQENH